MPVGPKCYVKIETNHGIAGWGFPATNDERPAMKVTVTRADGGYRCSCPWWAKYGGRRGPCKHVLAVTMTAPPST